MYIALSKKRLLTFLSLAIGRKLWREVVDRSYNVTVPLLLEKYPSVFPAQMLIPEKWAWACRYVATESSTRSSSACTAITAAAQRLKPWLHVRLVRRAPSLQATRLAVDATHVCAT